jgi:hypothetical protein
MKIKSWMVLVGSVAFIFLISIALHVVHGSTLMSIGGIIFGFILLEVGAWVQRLQEEEKYVAKG